MHKNRKYRYPSTCLWKRLKINRKRKWRSVVLQRVKFSPINKRMNLRTSLLHQNIFWLITKRNKNSCPLLCQECFWLKQLPKEENGRERLDWFVAFIKRHTDFSIHVSKPTGLVQDRRFNAPQVAELLTRFAEALAHYKFETAEERV